MNLFTYLKELFTHNGAEFACNIAESFTGIEEYWDPTFMK